jgi:hypothetical protein
MTIGIIMTSGGMGKKELSIKAIKANNGFEFLCPAQSTHLSYIFLIIFCLSFNKYLILFYYEY